MLSLSRNLDFKARKLILMKLNQKLVKTDTDAFEQIQKLSSKNIEIVEGQVLDGSYNF